MKNEEILSIVILLIVIITAVSVLILASADTNPKNLTVDSDQIIRPAQKAKTDTPAILITALIGTTTISVATLLAIKSKAGAKDGLSLTSQGAPTPEDWDISVPLTLFYMAITLSALYCAGMILIACLDAIIYRLNNSSTRS